MPDTIANNGLWWERPGGIAAMSVEESCEILELRAVYLNSFTAEGIQLRVLLEHVQKLYELGVEDVRRAVPCAFFVPSWEQTLLLNAWWCGINFPICFSANRIGKTVAFIINAILWILPNNPQWLVFLRREDSHGREDFQVLQRPPIEAMPILRAYLMEHPELRGNPRQQFTHPENWEKFATLQRALPEVFDNVAWPAAPITRGSTIWLGAPDREYHKTIVFKLWKQWLPAACVENWSLSTLSFQINTREETNPCPIVVDVVGKSYEQDDTKWSGVAVEAIVLTEGIDNRILSEIKQRIIANGFASWDYTPYEAANTGEKTAIALRVKDGKEELPLVPYVFDKFSARKAPEHILPVEKRLDLIRMWEGKPQGAARLDGEFYTSSPKILAKLDRPFHCLDWSIQELFQRYPNGQLFRSIDPGFDHPTTCAWALLSPQNIWFIYRFYSERQRSITQRCKDIIELSGNRQYRRFFGKKETDFMQMECHINPHSEKYIATLCDYHTFHIDETTGQSLAVRYFNEGLPIISSVTIEPRDRAMDIDKALDPVPFYTHPVTKKTPGARVFFLINGSGVSDALDQMETLYWERYRTGDKKDQPKDAVPELGDDELDALGQLISSPFKWNNVVAPQVNPPADREDKWDVSPLPGEGRAKPPVATLQNDFSNIQLNPIPGLTQ